MNDGGPRASLPRLDGLDGLRAVAVIAVVAFHGGVGGLRGGFLGVDIFFVLSGFLITGLLMDEVDRRGTVDLRDFWARRFRRLVPALLLMLLGVALYGVLIAEPSTRPGLRLDSLASLFYVANWRFIWAGDSYFDAIAAPSPVRHLWSLAVEEQWYLLWPPACALALPRLSRRVVGLVIATAAVASAVQMSRLTPNVGDTSRAYYGTDARAQALLIGAGLSVALWRHRQARGPLPHGASRSVAAVAVGVAAVLLAAAVIGIDENARWMYHGGFAAVALLTAVLIAGVVLLPTVDGALGVAPLAWIGRRSYAIYLWHWPVGLTLSVSRLGVGGWTRFVIVVAATVALSELSYRLVENPIRTRRLTSPRPTATALIATAVVGLALVGATIGAEAPPEYSVAPTDDPVIVEAASTTTSTTPSVTGVPTTVDATAGSSTIAEPTTPPSPLRHPRRVVLAGDSVAFSIQDALARELSARGITFAGYAFPGCGIVTGSPVADDGSRIDTCTAIASRQREAVDRVRPDLVLLYSAWETSDREVDGITYRKGTPEFVTMLVGLYEATLSRVQAGGAQVLFVLALPSGDGNATARDSVHDAQLRSMNDVMTAVARRHPGSVGVMSVQDVVCPSDPCPNEVNGVAYRPVDGSHFEMPAAQPVVRAFSDRISGLDLDALAVP